MITRRLFLKRSALAAPAVILTPHLLMPVRHIIGPDLITIQFDIRGDALALLDGVRADILRQVAGELQIPAEYLIRNAVRFVSIESGCVLLHDKEWDNYTHGAI